MVVIFWQKVINREVVAIVGECLKILMLLQTLSKDSDCQKGLMNLFLETILMIFTIPEDNSEVLLNHTVFGFVSSAVSIRPFMLITVHLNCRK